MMKDLPPWAQAELQRVLDRIAQRRLAEHLGLDPPPPITETDVQRVVRLAEAHSVRKVASRKRNR